jgi:hypothetical protein
MLPAFGMGVALVYSEPKVSQAHDGPIAIWDEANLHCAGPGREAISFLFPSPCEDHPAVGDHFNVFAPRDVSSGDIYAKYPSRPWVQGGVYALPTDHLRRVGEEREDGLRAGGYPYLSFYSVTPV